VVAKFRTPSFRGVAIQLGHETTPNVTTKNQPALGTDGKHAMTMMSPASDN
jgi:hypothetical protein